MAPLPCPRHPILATDRPPDDGWGPHDGDARRISPPPVHRIDDPWLPHGPRRRLNQGYRRGVQRRDLFSAHEPTTTRTHHTRQDDELLDWVFPSLGMLGIVTRMTLKMVPSYKLRATCTVMSLADFQARACTHAPCLRGTLHPGAPLLSPSNQARRRQTPLPLSRRRSRSLTSPVTTSTHASSSTQPTSRRVCGPFLDPLVPFKPSTT